MIHRLLTADEMTKFTNCTHYEEISPPGNLINKETNWNISGTLIKTLEISGEDIDCASRLDLNK